MDDQKTIKEKIQDEIKKIKEMEPKKRLTYFKDYYLGKVLVILAIILIIASMLNEMVFSRKDSLYTGGLLGCHITEEGKTALTEGFLTELNGNPKKEIVYLYDDLVMNFIEGEGESYMNSDVETAVYTMIAAGEFNYMISTDTFVEKYEDAGVFLDATEYADKYNIAEEDRYIHNNEVIAIKLSDEVCKKYGLLSDENMYLSIMPSRDNTENDNAFIEYLLF